MIEVLSLYEGLPWRERAHVAARLRTCPIEAIARAVPRSGRVLDLGSGHGLISCYLALESAGRVVQGVDVDPRKIAAAVHAGRRALARGASVGFEVLLAGEVPAGPWDAVLIVDVLYLLSPAEERALLTRAAAELSPGGLLIVKEMAARPRWKATWNRIQEALSVRILGITAGERLTFLPPETLAGWMRTELLSVEQRALDRGYPHPHHLLVGSRREPC